MSDYRNIWNEAGIFEKIAGMSGISSSEDMEISKANEGAVSYFTILLKKNLVGNQTLRENLKCKINRLLLELLKKNGYKCGDGILVVGLGNENITADSLGARSIVGLEASRHLIKERTENRLMLSCIKPLVEGVTGISSFDIIKGVVRETKPKHVICIDTLACSAVKRIGRAFQLSDGGLTPGGGVSNAKQCINIDSLGVPVYALGVPLVIYAKNILREYLIDKTGKAILDDFLNTFIVTEKDVDLTVEEFAYCISGAINDL